MRREEMKKETSSILKYLLGFLVGIMVGHLNPPISTEGTETASKGVHVQLNINKNDDNNNEVSKIELPLAVKDLIINIGSNLDPILPDPSLGPCARTIAVEPIVGCKIIPHPQLDVLNAAIAGSPSIATMKIYNSNGVSSSLADPASTQNWNNNAKRGDGERRIVPVVSMKSFLLAIPDHATIQHLRTDMQGFDFAAVSSAGPELLAKVAILETEVWKDDVMTYAAHNDLCRDWYPFMTKLGYKYHSYDCKVTPDKIASYCQAQLERSPERPPLATSSGLRECNAVWVKQGHTLSSQKPYVGYNIRNAVAQHRFTDEEYKQCQFE